LYDSRLTKLGLREDPYSKGALFYAK